MFHLIFSFCDTHAETSVAPCDRDPRVRRLGGSTIAGGTAKSVNLETTSNRRAAASARSFVTRAAAPRDEVAHAVDHSSRSSDESALGTALRYRDDGPSAIHHRGAMRVHHVPGETLRAGENALLYPTPSFRLLKKCLQFWELEASVSDSGPGGSLLQF